MNYLINKNIVLLKSLLISALVLVCISACKQEPQYHLKEPFGNNTAAPGDNEELGPDIIRIPKKNFDRNKWEEKQRKRRAIKKILKQAREWDPKYNQ